LKQVVLNFLKSKNLNNAAWSSVDAIVYPALMLLATPVFINKLGVELYGIWMFINTIMASIGILNIGLGDATVKFVSKYLVAGEREKVNKIIGATYSVYLVLCAVVVLVAIVSSFVVREYNWLHLAEGRTTVVFYTIQIAGLTLGLKFIEQIFLAVFKGYERYDLSAKISILGKVTTLGVNLLLVVLDFSLIHIFIGSCFVTFIYLLIEAWLVYRFSNFTHFIPLFERKYIREIFSFGIWTWFQSIIGILSGQVDKFIVISLSDIKTFAYYSIALTIFTQIHSVFSASVAWIFPVISKKIYMGEKVDHLYNKIQFYFLGVATILLAVFYVIKDPFILMWLKEDTYKNTIDFISLFICYNLVMATTIIPYYFLNGSSHFRLNTLFMLLNLASRALFIPLLYYFMDTQGLVIGLIISGLAVTPVQMHYFTKKILGVRDMLAGVKIMVPSILFLVVFSKNTILLSVLCLAVILIWYKFIFRPSTNPS